MNVKNYEIRDDLLYTKEHEWAKPVGGVVRVGISDYAAKTLNDVVYVSLPSPGTILEQMRRFGTVESIKAVSELYSPFSGKLVRVNSDLNSHPELVNQSPYDNGWLIELKPEKYETEMNSLLNARAYANLISTLGK